MRYSARCLSAICTESQSIGSEQHKQLLLRDQSCRVKAQPSVGLNVVQISGSIILCGSSTVYGTVAGASHANVSENRGQEWGQERRQDDCTVTTR